MTVQLKALTPRDREAVMRLFVDVFTNPPWNDDWSDAAQLDAYIADLTGQHNSLALGWFDGERLVAMALGQIKHWYSGTEYLIDELCVDRAAQGRGVGSAFLRAVETHLLERGICRIFLQTERGVPAYSFYKKRGFIELQDHVSFSKRLD